MIKYELPNDHHAEEFKTYMTEVSTWVDEQNITTRRRLDISKKLSSVYSVISLGAFGTNVYSVLFQKTSLKDHPELHFWQKQAVVDAAFINRKPASKRNEEKFLSAYSVYTDMMIVPWSYYRKPLF